MNADLTLAAAPVGSGAGVNSADGVGITVGADDAGGGTGRDVTIVTGTSVGVGALVEAHPDARITTITPPTQLRSVSARMVSPSTVLLARRDEAGQRERV